MYKFDGLLLRVVLVLYDGLCLCDSGGGLDVDVEGLAFDGFALEAHGKASGRQAASGATDSRLWDERLASVELVQWLTGH